MSLDLKFDHAKTDTIDNRQSRDIGNRLLALHLIELIIKVASKLALLAAIIWTVNTVLQHIDKTADNGRTTLPDDVQQPCGPLKGRIQNH